jgi:pyruvate formate lyase activating enzyme
MPINSKAIIFDIQRFSLHDGPGIRTTVFFKGCPLQCAWCQNPESWATGPEIAFYSHLCRQCFTCRSVCADQAIVAAADRRVDYAGCSICGKCAAACVDNALRLIGQDWSPDDLVAELLKDADYFAESGGGVTLSGGEPTLQSRFLESFLPALKLHRVHVTLETCGLFNWSRFEALLPHLDLVYYDLKIMDTTRHKQYTGTGNDAIVDNFKRLSNTTAGLQARMPVIPGVNDTQGNIAATADFLKSSGQTTVHLLPYHNLGEAKIPRLNTTQKRLSLVALNHAELKRVQTGFAEQGVDAILYD